MKKIILGTMLASALLMANQGNGNGFENNEGFSHKDRAERVMAKKAKITQKIDKRIAKLQKAKACVQSATTPDELRKCRPQRKNGKNGKGMHNFKGQGIE